MGKIDVNLDLIRKYNVQGPRYTSYPPANHFTEDVDFDEVESCIARSNESGNDISLYVHLPFCPSLCTYCGCTNVISRKPGKTAEYLRYLQREVELIHPYLDNHRNVVQLHLGGGTPTYLEASEIAELGQMLRQNFQLSPKIEASVEIDPRRLTLEKVTALQQAGFSRASLGIQDTNPKVQKAVNRVQPTEMVEQGITWLRANGFNSINFDLVYGLPHQTAESFSQTLDDVLALAPDRMTVFSYAHVPWIKPTQKRLGEWLPTAETKLEILQLTIEKLTGEGYVYIGMDHFAKPDDALCIAQQNRSLQRNFQGYSTFAGAEIFALGMSSISHADRAYWQNEKTIDAYYAALDSGRLPWFRGYVASDDDGIRYRTIMRLMCDLGLNYADLSAALGIDFKAYFAEELASLADLEDDGLLVTSTDGVEVTEMGRLLIRVIAMRFDKYLRKKTGNQYSRTI